MKRRKTRKPGTWANGYATGTLKRTKGEVLACRLPLELYNEVLGQIERLGLTKNEYLSKAIELALEKGDDLMPQGFLIARSSPCAVCG